MDDGTLKELIAGWKFDERCLVHSQEQRLIRLAVAEVERLQTRLREQTLQTQRTAQQIHARVVDVLERYGVVPDGLDVQGHPIEQVVGTCLATVQLKAAEAAGEES